ncbi:MAG: acyl-CoA dehydratase activase [Candidatus Brocadiia bacterium]
MRVTCGVDIGARTVKAVLFDVDSSSVIASEVVLENANPQETAQKLVERLCSTVKGLHWPDTVIATGYGRRHCLFADDATTEITCHAVGCRSIFPDVGLVVDIGGQDSKIIVLSEDGAVCDFEMNDRCAAGTGLFFEMACSLLSVDLREAGKLAAEAKDAAEISSMCAVFAQTEIVSLVQSGIATPAVLAGICRSIAKRTSALLGSRRLRGRIVFTGGVALNRGVVLALSKELGQPVSVPESPQTTGALGAALLGIRRL